MSNSLKVSEPSIGMFSEENKPNFHTSFIWPRDKVLDVSVKCRKGWKEESITFSFLITVNFPCFIWLSTFIKTSCLPRWMSDTIKAPDRSTCGYRGSGTLGSDYTLWAYGALPHPLLWVAFCWFKARWHGDRWVQTTDIINCNLASKDEWRSNALICDSELSCSIYRKTCLWGKGKKERDLCRENSLWHWKIFSLLQMTWRNLRV